MWSGSCQIIWMIPSHNPIQFVPFSSTTLIICPQLNMALVFPYLPWHVCSLLMDIWVVRSKERWRDALTYLSEGLLFLYGPGSRTRSCVHNGQVSYHCATIQARLPFSEASADKAWMVDLPCTLSAGSLQSRREAYRLLLGLPPTSPCCSPWGSSRRAFPQISWDFCMTFLLLPPRFFLPVQWLQLLVRTGEGWKPVGNEGPFIGLVLPHTAIFLTDAITSECCREWDLMFYFFIHHFTNGFHCKKEIAFVARFFLLRAGGLQALVFIPAGATATLLLTGRNEPGRWEGNQAKFT